MPPGGRNSRCRMFCTTRTVCRLNICCRPSGSISGCNATGSKPRTERSFVFFTPDSSASKAGRIFTTPFYRSATMRRVPATWRLICTPAAGARMATTGTNIFKTCCCTSFGTNRSYRPVKPDPPVLPLKTVLDAPLAELSLSFENEPLRLLPEKLRGKCSAPLRELSEPRLAELLQAAAEIRFRGKAAAMLVHAKNAGWEQALWENLFRALGYKHNVWPMQHLAETRQRWSRGTKSAFEIQARLLGVSGLLPGDLTRAAKKFRHFFAARLGFLVARPRRIGKLRAAARGVEISRSAPGESSAAPARVGSTLARGEKSGFRN